MNDIIVDFDKNHGDPKELFAYVSVDEDGNTGICATFMEGLGFVTFVGSTLKDMKRYDDYIETMKEAGIQKEIKLIRYEAVQEIVKVW